MPGRFTLTASAEALGASFPDLQIPPQYAPRYNIAPSQPVAVITNDRPNALSHLQWNLIPSWQKGVKLTNTLINARAESVARKASFRDSFRRRRCLVLADGVFEWVKEKGKRLKTPYYIYLKDRPVFAFAGIWDRWLSIDGSEVLSCAIITAEPNDLVRTIHHRMGVILHAADYATWLQPDEADHHTLQPLLRPYPSEHMTFHKVSTSVSNPKNDHPEVIQPIAEPGLL